MAKRKLLAIIIALALTLGVLVCFSGCGITTKGSIPEVEGLEFLTRKFRMLEEYRYDQVFLYDPETLVMYCLISCRDGTDITMLYNADGTPRLTTKGSETEVEGLVLLTREQNIVEDYWYDQTFLYDSETRVIYCLVCNNNGSNITMMYNADGTPRLYNPGNN